MKYPNRMQSALLLDARFDGLDAIASDLARIVRMKSGATFNTIEHKPGVFLRLFGGGDELMLTFEYVPGPPDPAVFAQAMGSPVTTILCPDMGARLLRAQAMILLEVSHGRMGGLEDKPGIASMFETLGLKQGASPEQFTRRLETLALMTRVATDRITPCAIHWTLSNQLFEPRAFEAFATAGFPGPLSVHPYLFGPDDQDAATPEATLETKAKAGIRTFGARHWLGRELYVAPTTLPWGAAYETLLTFLRIATMENGYIIPDGDIFGPEDGSQKWRVHHRDPGEIPGANPGANPGAVSPEQGGAALYELVPLRHDRCGFVDPGYAREARIVCEAGGAIMGDYSARELYGEEAPAIAEARALVEGIGGHLMVTALDERPTAFDAPSTSLAAMQAARPPAPAHPKPPAPRPSQPGDNSVSGRDLRARLFGRKGA